MTTVRKWTGIETRALREALRLSVQSFAEHLGVASRTVAHWEARGEHLIPRLEIQSALDTVLARADTPVQSRFRLLLDTSSGNVEFVPPDEAAASSFAPES